MSDNDPINMTINTVVRRILEGRRINRVSTRYDETFDGDEILSVSVVIDDAITDFDPRAMASLVRHIRPALAREHHVNTFPIISFMTVREAEGLAA